MKWEKFWTVGELSWTDPVLYGVLLWSEEPCGIMGNVFSCRIYIEWMHFWCACTYVGWLPCDGWDMWGSFHLVLYYFMRPSQSPVTWHLSVLWFKKNKKSIFPAFLVICYGNPILLQQTYILRCLLLTSCSSGVWTHLNTRVASVCTGSWGAVRQ